MGWLLAVGQHLTHLSSRKMNVLGLVMRTGLIRSHALTGLAEETVFELERPYSEFTGLELFEDLLGVVSPVVVADTRMVSTNDEMRHPVVLTKQRMPDRFARPPVPHGCREYRQDDAVLRVVVVHQNSIALHTNVGRNVVPFGAADKRMDHQAVNDLECDLRQVLMRSVDRVPGLKGNHRLPPPACDLLPQLQWR